MEKHDNSLASAIIVAGIVVGTLDLTAAIIQTIIMGGNPLKMLQYISSGILGPDSFAGGIKFSLLGVFIHYCIAFSWTIIFFLLYPKIKAMAVNRLLAGILYGIIVWLFMNRLVIPLSRIPERPFNLANAIIGLGILVIAIGIPLSFMAAKYYERKSDSIK